MEDFSQEIFPPLPKKPELTPGGFPVQKKMEHTGYPFHTEGGRFKPGHRKLGGVKKGYKTFKTRFMEEMRENVLDEQGRTVNNSMAITKKAFELARKGDLKAIEFIIERIDGKIPTVVAGDQDRPLQVVIEQVIANKYGKLSDI